MAYTLANPTVAGLVKSPDEWPGVISHRFGESRDVEMPDAFFDFEGDLPDSVALEFVRPPIFPALSNPELQARLHDAVAKLVRRAREDMALRGLPLLGATPCSGRVSALYRKRRLPDEIRAHVSRQNPGPRARDQAYARIRPRIPRSLERMAQRKPRCCLPLGTYALRIYYARVACAQAVPA